MQRSPLSRILSHVDVLAAMTLAGGLFAASAVLDATPVAARDSGAKSAAAQARAAKAEQKKAERAAKREERNAKKAAKKSAHDSAADTQLASTKGAKPAKAPGKQAIDDPHLSDSSADSDPLDGL